jgi:hypothetical protein
VSRSTDSVIRYDGTTGDFIGAFVASGSGGLSDPHFLTFGPEPTQVVPEPASLFLLASGLLAASARKRCGRPCAPRPHRAH